jgi:hypothetical protein
MNLLGYRMSRATPDRELTEFLTAMRAHVTEAPLVRIGGPGDGGYLVPDLMDGIAACFSPGVAQTSGFETELAQRGIRSFMADYSVEGPATDNPLFTFEKKFLGTRNDAVFTRLEDWMVRSLDGIEGDLILQMDIEGAEYPVLLDTPPKVLRRFRIMVIELHDFDQVFVRSAFRFYQQTIERLLRDFVVVHIHPNNGTKPRTNGRIDVPKVLEITLLRRDHVRIVEGAKPVYPHPLDAPNVTGKADAVLPLAMQ